MKKTLFGWAVAATFLAMTACNETKPLIYTVKGTVPDSMNGINVYLYSCGLNNKKIGQTVVENGQYQFSDTLQQPLVAKVAIGDKNKKIVGCALDEVPVVVTYGDKGIHVTGSRRTEAMVEYEKICEEYANSTKKKHREVSYQSGKKTVNKLTEEQIRENEEIHKHNQAVFAKYNNDLKEFVKRNCDNVVGAYVFDYLYVGNGIDEEIELQDSILAVAGEEFLQTPGVQYTLSAHNQRVGHTYTDFEFPDKDGKMHKLSDYVGEGKYVLLDIWASWCIGCRIEIPKIKEAYAKYHDRGFEVVMVSVDEKETNWINAMEGDGVKDVGCQLSDTNDVMAGLYGISSLPCSMLIDPQGKIIANNLRRNELEEKLSKLIGE